MLFRATAIWFFAAVAAVSFGCASGDDETEKSGGGIPPLGTFCFTLTGLDEMCADESSDVTVTSDGSTEFSVGWTIQDHNLVQGVAVSGRIAEGASLPRDVQQPHAGIGLRLTVIRPHDEFNGTCRPQDPIETLCPMGPTDDPAVNLLALSADAVAASFAAEFAIDDLEAPVGFGDTVRVCGTFYEIECVVNGEISIPAVDPEGPWDLTGRFNLSL